MLLSLMVVPVSTSSQAQGQDDDISTVLDLGPVRASLRFRFSAVFHLVHGGTVAHRLIKMQALESSGNSWRDEPFHLSINVVGFG